MAKSKGYDHLKLEKKWQAIWAKNKFKNWQAKDFSSKKPMFVLDMFPYPSGDGLHVGHVEGYTASDILSRYFRAQGYNVLHPMGWDAFGLPAENYAIKNKVNPAISTKKNIEHFRKQMQMMGLSYDWSREINTTDPGYYKWTQWIFLELYKHGLAYEADMPVNWCPKCKTVLADEEVKDSKCDRCGALVEHKNIRQWMLRITAYADRLLNDLPLLNWPEKIKIMQTNWIGRSEGTEVEFKIENTDLKIKVFTTRVDTIYGATYLVLSPENPLINQITTAEFKKKVIIYRDEARKKSDLERQGTNSSKTGVFTGAYAINPANKKLIPIWVADYILMSYGTGAVMGVPAHDSRDWQFAKQFDLSIVQVISKDGQSEKKLEGPLTASGVLVNSGIFDGLSTDVAANKINTYLSGKKVVHYKLRDWVFARQRYWGEPIPLIKCPICGVQPIPVKDLPLKLPKVEHYEPTGTGESPLAKISSWVNVRCPKCGGPAKRETNTMPQWAGSSWYYLRYLDPKNNKQLVDSKKEKYWLANKKSEHFGVHLYIGGVEHAVLHLLYARFWHKFLYDLGVVSNKEPFYKLVNQGMILGSGHEKMSKSKGNVVNPDEIVEKYGADALRLYEMFMGPLQDSKPWSTDGVIGITRFLDKVWLVSEKVAEPKKKNHVAAKENKIVLEKLKAETIKKVTQDIEGFRFNTAISSMMIYTNALLDADFPIDKNHLATLIKLLNPFAPHITEEIWQTVLLKKKPLELEPWPKWEEKNMVKKTAIIAVQINGKFRGNVETPIGLNQVDVLNLAQKIEAIDKYLEHQNIKKIVYIQDKLLNVVI